MFRIRKLFKFEAAHILEGAYSEVCTATIHGHSYKIELFLVAKELNTDEMVLDFKHLGGMWACYDHALFLPPSMDSQPYRKNSTSRVFQLGANPTAEVMARHFYVTVNDYLQDKHSDEYNRRFWVEKVRVHETDTGWAEYKPEEPRDG